MIHDVIFDSASASVEHRQKITRRNQTIVLTAAILVSIITLWMMRSQPSAAAFGWAIYLIGAGVILYQPRYGLYMILTYALIADTNLILWWPFTANFSSEWSLFFLNKALVISPIEIYMVLTLGAWWVKGELRGELKIFRGKLLLPAAIFVGFLIFGLIYGLRRGGDRVIGLSEVRPLFYLAMMIFLASNLITERKHINTLIWFAMGAIAIVGAAGIYTYFFILYGDITGIRSMALHATAVHMNTLFVLILTAWMYKASWAKRLGLPALALLIVLPYFVTQRRAAFIGLFIALALMAVLLFIENRRAFWIIVPVVGLFALAYIGAFWNNDGALGEPVKAIKSVVAPSELGAEDASSNYYRVLENANLSYTMHQRPFTGVGFGQVFYVIYPMPDISFFDRWQYLPHNSIIWVWLKMGMGGFLVTLYLISQSILMGTRLLQKLKPDDHDMKAIFAMLTLYLVMHFLYAYVDISFDARSMVYIGVAMGMIDRFQHLGFPQIEKLATVKVWQPRIIDAINE